MNNNRKNACRNSKLSNLQFVAPDQQADEQRQLELDLEEGLADKVTDLKEIARRPLTRTEARQFVRIARGLPEEDEPTVEPGEVSEIRRLFMNLRKRRPLRDDEG